MTPLPHNPAITVIDLPEYAMNPVIASEKILYRFDNGSWGKVLIPPGNYKLICLGLQAAEEDAREIVQAVDGGYLKYGSLKPLMERLANMGNPWYSDYSYYKTALPSLRSLITSNGWINPVFLRKEK